MPIKQQKKSSRKSVVKVNLWDHFHKVSLAAQRLALIEAALHLKDPMNEDDAFNWIMKLADNNDGEFLLDDFDGFTYRGSGRVRVQFEYDDSRKVIPNILFELE